MNDRYAESQRWLDRALRTIPLGSQTFSKSHVQYPRGVSPHFVARGRGARVWDVDGNEYVDLVCGLASVSLGYCDPDVDRAVVDQVARGVTFTLPHPLEVEIAEAVAAMVPCAEQVRFGKNGSDATAAAIRLARAHTGREHVAVCGYHGWQDWYVGSTTRHLGVPGAVRALTHTFAYNDPDSLRRVLQAQPIAAVILEPMNVQAPQDDFLRVVRELCHAHGALLVFDETVTGCRFAPGGAQELFGVTPDLATFGKGLANGLPLSVVVGRAEVMAGMTEIFFSTTFGGETLALAAAGAVMQKMRREHVTVGMAQKGQVLRDGTAAHLAAAGLGEVIRLGGHPSWTFLLFGAAGPYEPLALKTLFLQECFQRGVLTLGTHNVCHALDERDIAHVLAAYGEVFPILREAIDREDLPSRLRCDVLQPVFRVR